MPWTWLTTTARRPFIHTKWHHYNRFISQQTAPLTPAQISRAAWQAVHISLKSPLGGVESALLIVNSLRYSTFKQDPVAQQPSAVREFGRRVPSSLDFAQNASPRLASHALLHALMRMRRDQQAHTLALEMMEAGMQLRKRTLTTLIGSHLPSTPLQVAPAPTLPHIKFCVNSKRSLNNLVNVADTPSTKMALEIFAVAKQTHQRNTNGILGTLIAICLVNAEVILASLVFAFIVKEFNNSAAADTDVAATNNTETASSTPSQTRPKGIRLVPTHEMLFSIVQPIRRILEMSNPHPPGSYEDSQHTLRVNSSLQALVNLAFLLDERLIPISSMSSLLRTMYNCPRVDYRVWVLDGNGKDEVKEVDRSDEYRDTNHTPQNVAAYNYLHAVLKRLITAPPRYRRHPKATTPTTVPLNLGACNTLLHYTLRHLASPTLANSVLKYMVLDREKPLEPDETTYAILVRSGTLLRNRELVNAALRGLEGEVIGKTVRERLRSSNSESTDDPPVPDAPSPLPAFPLPLSPSVLPYTRPRPHYALPDPTATTMPPTVITIIHRLRSLDLGDLNSRSEMPQLLHILTTLFMEYISTGKPELVFFLHYELFPELNIPFYGIGKRGEKLRDERLGVKRKRTNSRRSNHDYDYGGVPPTWGITRGFKRSTKSTPRMLDAPVTREEVKQRKLARRAMVIRASKYGPQVFSVILTALLKANRLGAAKAFWRFAKRAESMSWEKGSLRAYAEGWKEWDEVERKKARMWEPWVLDESAYTVMLQVWRVEWEAPLSKRNGRVGSDSSEEEKAEVTEAVRLMSVNRGVTIYRQIQKVEWEVEEALLSRQKRGEQRTGSRGERELKIGKEGVAEIMKALRFPMMDARFFTAAIALLVFPAITGVKYSSYHNDRLLVMQHSTPIGSKKPPRSLVISELEMLERWYAETGRTVKVPRHLAPILDEIGRDLVKAGFDIPLGLRKLFLGRGPKAVDTAREGEGRAPLVQILHPHPPVVPFQFPDAKPGWQPLVVPSMRTRGFPKVKRRSVAAKGRTSNIRRRRGR